MLNNYVNEHFIVCFALSDSHNFKLTNTAFICLAKKSQGIRQLVKLSLSLSACLFIFTIFALYDCVTTQQFGKMLVVIIITLIIRNLMARGYLSVNWIE